MNTRNDWYVACVDTDIDDGAPFAATILDERIVLWRSEGRIVALEDRCVHRAAALSQGRCEGAHLRCMYHGLLFDRSGTVVEIPGQDVVPPTARVRSYPTATRFGWIWVWMGDPALADTAKLPALFDGVDLNEFGMAGGQLDFAANAQLISDNLLDFSHLPFVHADSFQAPLDWAKSTMTMTMLDRGVRFERWLVDQPGNGFFIEELHGGPCDEWMGYDYLIPGVLIMWVAAFPPGTGRACNLGRPDLSLANARVQTNVQAITPVNSQLSRYFFTTGMHLALGGGTDPALVQRNFDVTQQAFNEDKRIIEAQQANIARDPDRPFVPTVHDKGVTLYTRLKARLIAAENGASSAAKVAEPA